jgi:formylmethanofuran dehydrogenase subunit C
MTPVRLRFRAATSLPVAAAALTPVSLAGRTVAELAALPLRVGNALVPLGEVAEVAAGDADTLVIEDAFAGLDRLGHGMESGRLEIHGDAGAYLGQGMIGGRIDLFGSTGVLAAAGMRGGVIRIAGDAGDFLGAALPGDPHGMMEGTVLVGGNAGDRVGDRMRRGLIAVAGRLGEGAASRMIGGTIVALQGCGADPGYAMRRGSLILGRPAANLLATFVDNGAHTLPWLGLLARQLAALDPPVTLPGIRVDRWTGCASTGGKGEILVSSPP